MPPANRVSPLHAAHAHARRQHLLLHHRAARARARRRHPKGRPLGRLHRGHRAAQPGAQQAGAPRPGHDGRGDTDGQGEARGQLAGRGGGWGCAGRGSTCLKRRARWVSLPLPPLPLLRQAAAPALPAHPAHAHALPARPQVLPIGGVKEKTLAARRAGVKTLVFPEANRRDWEELSADLREGLDVHFASSYEQVRCGCVGVCGWVCGGVQGLRLLPGPMSGWGWGWGGVGRGRSHWPGAAPTARSAC
jgi:hypothetical protein